MLPGVRPAIILVERGSEMTNIADAQLRKVLLEKGKERLNQMTHYAMSTRCLRQQILQYFGEIAPNSCGNCFCCVEKYEEKDVTLEAKKLSLVFIEDNRMIII